MKTTRAEIDYSALVQEDRVHGSAYTDPDIFVDEMSKIFHRGWVYVGHASEVPQPGDFRVTTIGQQSVIMVRAPLLHRYEAGKSAGCTISSATWAMAAAFVRWLRALSASRWRPATPGRT